MAAKVTRRQLALGVAAATAAAAQTPEEDRKAVEGQAQQNTEALAKVDVAMNIEPAFIFRA